MAQATCREKPGTTPGRLLEKAARQIDLLWHLLNDPNTGDLPANHQKTRGKTASFSFRFSNQMK